VHRGESILHPSLSRELFNEFASLAKTKNSEKCCLASRELEIIRLIANGTSNKEIAAKLFLSETTVKRGVSRIFDKLGAKDRAESVAEAYRRGLL
ncbi:MAG: response regulator transcription factor, partial [Dehalococcoidia bacterium]